MTAPWLSSGRAKKSYLKQPSPLLGIARRKSHSQLICGSRYEYKESFVFEVMTVCVGHWLTRCWYVGLFVLAKCFLGLFFIFGEVMADVYYLTSDLVRENPDAQTGIAAITIGWRLVGRHWRDVGRTRWRMLTDALKDHDRTEMWITFKLFFEKAPAGDWCI